MHILCAKHTVYYCCAYVVYKWFENYLYDRQQIVKYNGVQSDKMTIKSGIRQGFVLGPLLFLLYINDIENCSEFVSSILFADDTNILYSHTCLKTLNTIIQVELDKIADGLGVNTLSINAKKN